MPAVCTATVPVGELIAPAPAHCMTHRISVVEHIGYGSRFALCSLDVSSVFFELLAALCFLCSSLRGKVQAVVLPGIFVARFFFLRADGHEGEVVPVTLGERAVAGDRVKIIEFQVGYIAHRLLIGIKVNTCKPQHGRIPWVPVLRGRGEDPGGEVSMEVFRAAWRAGAGGGGGKIWWRW